MTKKRISLCYKILTLCSLITGISMNLIKTTSAVSLISYYTLQSNSICAITFIWFVILELRNSKKKEYYYIIKGAIMICILITAVVYRIALAPNGFEMRALESSISNKQLANFLVHTLSPLLVILDYFLFDEKGKFKKFYPIIWILLPLGYIPYVYIYSFSGGRFYSIGGSREFGYKFLDYHMIGYAGVFVSVIIITLVILGVSYLLVIFDYLMGKRRQ